MKKRAAAAPQMQSFIHKKVDYVLVMPSATDSTILVLKRDDKGLDLH
jgi:hypothetical protein